MENYKVIIVGGGLLGKTAAFELAQSGLIVACIYQRSRTRGQESSAAGGMLGIFSEVTAQDVDERRRLEVEHRWQARLLYQEWIESLHDFTDLPIYLQEGLFVIANAEGIEDAAQFRAIREAATWCGSRAEAVPVGTGASTGSTCFRRNVLTR